MPATGRRGATPVSPMNRTGKLFQAQLREKQAKDAAKEIDINEVRQQARLAGYREGFDQGFIAGWDALAQHLVDEGVLDADEPTDDSEDEAA